MVYIHTDMKGGYPGPPFEFAEGNLVSPKSIAQVDSRVLSQSLHVIDHCENHNDHSFLNLRFRLQ